MKKIYIFIIFVLFFCTNQDVFASNISMQSLSSVNNGESFVVLVSLDSEGILINTVDIEIDISTDLVSFSGFKDNQTLIKNWIKSPYEENGKIYMTGIIPGGAGGVYDATKEKLSPIPIVELLFKAKKEGNAKFVFSKSNVLKNDGLGTLLEISQNNLEINIKNEPEVSKTFIPNSFLIKEDEDINPPFPFEIYFIDSSNLSRTKDMIAFNTNDKESGIKEYRMKERGGKWSKVESPYVIKKGLFSKNITIRAYDFNNNWQESSIKIDGLITLKIWIIIFIFALFGSFLLYKLLK